LENLQEYIRDLLNWRNVFSPIFQVLQKYILVVFIVKKFKLLIRDGQERL